MAGKDNNYLYDRIRLLLHAFLGLIALIFYILVISSSTNLILFLYFFGGVLLYFKRAVVKKWLMRILHSRRFNSVKKYPRIILSKIPMVVWGGFAVFGIFLFGFLLGDGMSSEMLPEDKIAADKKLQEYKDVINSYEELSKLFYMQGQDMEIITDTSSWERYPEELGDALASYFQKREEIIFESGRLYEVRSRANLPEDEYFKND